jgi:hypothetical protein
MDSLRQNALGVVCRWVVELRTCLHTYDVVGVRNAAQKLCTEYGSSRRDGLGDYSSLISREIDYATDFCDRNENTIGLNRALTCGAAVRDGDYLEVSKIQVEELESAIESARLVSS